MSIDMKNQNCDCMTRRELIKLSVAAGVTLAAGGITKIAEAATKEKSSANKPEYAKQQFLKSMNCSQAILETYGPELGLPVSQARRVAAAFAGGGPIQFPATHAFGSAASRERVALRSRLVFPLHM